MSNMKRELERIATLQRESQRLRETLQYYAWLEEHGVSTPWETVKGIARLPSTYLRWNQIPKPYRPEKRDRSADVMGIAMRDGSHRILPWPPFSDAVIYNRSVLQGSQS